MLRAAGITAEYNPLHNGHIYHINETRRITGCDAVIVAMSGDYVQRGEPAIMDKWERTLNALRSGADLVVEIPVLFCLGNAGQYAEAAVSILEATCRVEHISFGSESADLAALTRIADVFREDAHEIDAAIRSMRGLGLSYPAARAQAYTERALAKGDSRSEADPEVLSDLKVLNSPNDILGIEYIRAMKTARPVAVKRAGAGYDDPFDDSAAFQNSSNIRKMARDGHDFSAYVPEYVASSLKSKHLTGADNDKWFDALRYAVLASEEEAIENCPSGGEGLASLLKSTVAAADSWSSLVKQIKSKRYTYTRLSRLCMQLVLGISRVKYDMNSPEYIRVLGFNSKGRELLAEMRDEETASLPVIVNVNKSVRNLSEKAAALLDLDIHAADIYNLMTSGNIREFSDHIHGPVILDE